MLATMLGPASLSAATYYIDCAAGADKSAGTATTTPWLHHPYMAGWTGAYSHSAGDRFIFKGGVTCPYTYFPLVPPVGGTSTAPDYYGISKTWYSGTAWTQPVWDMQGNSIGSSNVLVNLETYSPSNLTFDNFEIRGMYWSGNSPPYHGWAVFLAAVPGVSKLLITNCYFHGWSHGTAPGTLDVYTIVKGYNQGGVTNPGSEFSFNTVDGSDGDSASMEVVYNWPSSHDNLIHNVSNGIVGVSEVVYNNTLYNINNSFDSTTHENAIETWLANGDNATQYIYNNVIHDTQSSVQALYVNPGGANTSGSTAYVYNNLIYNIQYAYPVLFDTECLGSIACSPVSSTYTFWGNTVVAPGSTNACIRVVNRGTGNIGTATIQNTHCIADSNTLYAFDSGESINKLTANSNITMTTTVAGNQGYTKANQYAPASATASTVSAGTNLSASCGTLSELCTSILKAPRPPAPAAWDVGAYQYSTTGGVAPPTALTVTAK